ncbi:uncharacterized protein [Dermacentor andersoni]|uniref:uncharacterized protein n=1 Tax=Dermacentor andersoni TaxID=34620 RepID=UPI003B3AF053
MQVNYQYSLYARRTRYMALVVLPSPQCCIDIVFDCARVLHQLLILSRDVELNPGPSTRASETQTSSDIMTALTEIQSGEASLLKEMKSMQRKLSQSDSAIKEFKDHLVKIQEDCAPLVVIKEQVHDIRTLIKARLDDSEDRARRSNLVFFGLTDRERETWAESESLIIDLCCKELNVTVQSVDIERAHRLGKFKVNNNRPIIVKLSHFKVKEQILSQGRKLKGTEYRISEDYSPNTLTARRRLVEFAKKQQKPFKLRHDKLTIGNKA